MIKIIMIAYAKDGLTQEQFQNYYETVHAPLAQSLLPMMCEYRRNYIDRSRGSLKSGSRSPDFDVLTEMFVANEQDFEAFTRRITDPEVALVLRADEANFMKSELMRSHVVVTAELQAS
jgi:uncharacterized protein (TIGR02118 family)